MIYKLSLSLLIFFSVSSCTRGYFPTKPQFEMKNAIERKNARRLSQKGFYWYMNGGGDFGPLERIAAGFQTRNYRFTSIQEARVFFYHFVIDYIKPFNEDKAIRPYLRHFPLTAANFELVIQFVNEQGRQLEPPYIGSIWLRDGNMYYYEDTPFNSPVWKVIHKESFQEAEDIVKRSNP